MKLNPTPTSPKKTSTKKEIDHFLKGEDLKTIKQPNRKWRTPIILALIFAVLFGFLGGVLGEVVFNSYLLSNPNIIEKLFLISSTNQGNIGVTKTSKEINWMEIIAQTSSSLLKIYDQDGKTAEGFYLPEEALGNALILSSDGLAVTNDGVIADQSDKYIAVTPDRKIYSIDQFYDDPISHLIFFKIEAKGLAVLEMAQRDVASLGEEIIIVQNMADSQKRQIVKANLSDLHYSMNNQAAFYSSEEYADYLKIDRSLDLDYQAAVALNQNGRLLGLMAGEGDSLDLIITSDIINSALDSILKNDKISRNYLGVNYFDLNQVIEPTNEQNYGLKKGALISGQVASGQVAVLADSPAEQAGLQSGDIIINVGKIEVNQDNILSTIIQQYPLDEPVQLTIIRKGQEESINVTFKEIKE